MVSTKREHTLGIWALGLGYFLFYIPYSGLSKAVTSGLLTNGTPVPAFALLPSTVISTSLTMLLFITGMGWWKYALGSDTAGLVPRINPQTFISGLGFATIIITTTLAYSFSGVSIVFALILMRGGVLIMSPIIDRIFHRRVRWFSWAALGLSLLAILIPFTGVHEYKLNLAVLLNLSAYLLGYALRLPCMTNMAKTGEKSIAIGYFVQEQMVAMPALALIPAAFAAIGHGHIMGQLRFGFTHMFSSSHSLAGWAIGLFYTGLGIFCTFIYLDRRENTFCIPMYACSSMLSGIVATWILAKWFHAPGASNMQLAGAMLIMAALLIMSPLHHLPLYVAQIRDAVKQKRLVLVAFSKSAMASSRAPQQERFITVDFQALRQAARGSSRAARGLDV
jgi:hypothetical protein